jgi:pimeloyl-ACP methyl ester carboxylesterase
LDSLTRSLIRKSIKQLGEVTMAKLRVAAVFLFLLVALGTSPARAATCVSLKLACTDVDLGGGASGAYWQGTGAPHIAVVFTHRTADTRFSFINTELQARGFSTLGIKSRFPNEKSVDFEFIALDMRAAVRYARSQPGITRVVLFGWSGGTPVAALYQAIAENGPSFCQRPTKLTKCTGEVTVGWRASDKADGIVLLEGHDGTNELFSLNGAVTDEDDPDNLDPKLDPFSEANGYNPAGDSVYSQTFVDNYSKAQSQRMHHLILEAQKMRKDIEQGKRDPADNAFVYRRDSARLQQISTGVLGCTSKPRRLLRDDGTISDPHILCTVRLPAHLREADAQSIADLTITSFLSANAIESQQSEDRVDFCSTNYSPTCGFGSISVPVLVMQGQAHYFIWDGEHIFENSASIDKTYLMVEGLAHNALAGCVTCPGGPYPHARSNAFNFIRDWINTKF